MNDSRDAAGSQDQLDASAASSVTMLPQIYYSTQTRRQLDAGFLPLDNSERADWREYWPIRRHLLAQPTADMDCTGFFSPRFHEKSRLTTTPGKDAAPLKEFILERVASALMASQGHWRVRTHDPLRFKHANPRLAPLLLEMAVLDAFKIAHRTQGHEYFRQACHTPRKAHLDRLSGR